MEPKTIRTSDLSGPSSNFNQTTKGVKTGGDKYKTQNESSVNSTVPDNEYLKKLKTKTLYEKNDAIKTFGAYNAYKSDEKRKSHPESNDESIVKTSKRRRVSYDDSISDSIVLEAKRRFRNALMRKIYRHRNMRLLPWYNFASLYASATGGAVHADDLVKLFPYDFCDGDGGSIWTTSRSNRFGFKNDGNDDAESNADFLRRMEIEDMEKDLMQERELFEMIGETVKTLPKRTRSASMPTNPSLGLMKGSSDLKPQDSFANQFGSFSSIEEPKTPTKTTTTSTTAKTVPNTPTKPLPNTSAITRDDNNDDLSRKNRIDKTLEIVRRYKEQLFSKAARMGPMERAFYIDFDDIFGVNELIRRSSREDGEEEGEDVSYEEDPIARDAASEDPMIEPTFFALVKRCSDQLNVACGKRFLVKDLVRSDGINSFFASYVALQSTHVNVAMPTSKNWSRTSGFGGSGYSSSGNAVYVQHGVTRFAMMVNNKELRDAIAFFKNVYKDEDSGYLYHISRGPVRSDEEEEEEDYYRGYDYDAGNGRTREISYRDDASNLNGNNNYTAFDLAVRRNVMGNATFF